MESLVIIVFVLGYLAITLEHNLKLDKLIPALAMMAVLWALVAFGIDGFANWFDSGAHALVEGFSSFASEDKHHLLEETLSELKEHGVTFTTLVTLNDIDTYDDLVASKFYQSNIALQEKIKQLHD